MRRDARGFAILAGYVVLCVLWLQWTPQFLGVCKAFGGSYWCGLPEAGVPLYLWIIWIGVLLAVYVLPIGLVIFGVAQILWFIGRKRDPKQ